MSTGWVLLQDGCLLDCGHSISMPAAAARYMPAGLVLLSQTPLLFKHVYWLRTAARWMLAGLWPLNQHACCSCKIHACWPSVTVTNTATVQICLLVENCCKMDACWTVATQSACLLSPNIAWLLVLCFAICYTSWYGVSQSAVSAGIVSHYQPACWCGESL